MLTWRIWVKGMQEIFVKWSSIPCVANRWRYKRIVCSQDYSVQSIPPRSIPTTMELSWNFRMGKQIQLKFSPRRYSTQMPCGYGEELLLFSNSVARKTYSLGFHSPNSLICPGNYPPHGALSFLSYLG